MYYNANGEIESEELEAPVAEQQRAGRGRSGVAPEKAAKAKREIQKKVQTRKVKGNTPLQRYANVYIKNKDVLFPLMADAMGEPLPKDANHGELVALYIDLLKTNPEFKEKVGLMTGSDLNFENAMDPVSAIADAVGGIVEAIGSFKEGSNIEAQAEAQQDALLYQTILQGQKQNDSGKILVITGVSLLAVGAIIYLIVKKKK